MTPRSRSHFGVHGHSFDDVLALIIPLALEVHMSFPMTLGTLGFGTTEPDFEVVFAGWSA